MKIAALSLIGLFTISTASTVAAEDTDVPKKALRELEYRVGKWEGEGFTNGVKQPNPARETTRWCPGKRSIRIAGVFEEDGVKIQASGIVGWNAEKQQLVEHWYTSDGGYATFLYSLDKEKDAWVGTFKWVYADGKIHAGPSRVDKKGKDLWEWKASCMDDGKKLTWRSINKRVE